jgi:hypothetical protein
MKLPRRTKEPQRRHCVIENGCARALRNKMQLKAPDILEARRVRNIEADRIFWSTVGGL